LIEAKNLNNEIYGQEKMRQFLIKNYTLSAKDLEIAIMRNLYNHIGNIGNLMDDVTFLIMEVN
ncbi:MAG: SpoIIE family protein phosphatase, partial [Thermotaleaceae bacterium]